MARLLESRIPLTLGTAPFGTGIPKETAFTIMDSFLDRGGNILDTAAVYGMGVSEQTIGEWMKSRKLRTVIVQPSFNRTSISCLSSLERC